MFAAGAPIVTRLDSGQLRRIADAGGGRFIEIDSPGSMSSMNGGPGGARPRAGSRGGRDIAGRAVPVVRRRCCVRPAGGGGGAGVRMVVARTAGAGFSGLPGRAGGVGGAGRRLQRAGRRTGEPRGRGSLRGGRVRRGAGGLATGATTGTADGRRDRPAASSECRARSAPTGRVRAGRNGDALGAALGGHRDPGDGLVPRGQSSLGGRGSAGGAAGVHRGAARNSRSAGRQDQPGDHQRAARPA